MNFRVQSIIFFCLAFFVVSLTIIFHLLATYFYWYWTNDWIDMVVHFLGGLSAGLVFLWLVYSAGGRTSLIATILWVLIVGVDWEIYEYTSGLTFYSISFIFDTFSDLLMDIAGGIFAYLLISRPYFIGKVKQNNETTI